MSTPAEYIRPNPDQLEPGVLAIASFVPFIANRLEQWLPDQAKLSASSTQPYNE